MHRCIYAWARRTALAWVLLAAGQAAGAAGFTETKYPIVLVHGLFGYDSILGADYFFGVASSLRSDGARVFVVQVSAANNNEVRGEQLLQQVQRIVAITGAGKVNLIGHSQGGTTARYVLGVRPDLVASITTVGTPHTGTPVADTLAGVSGPLASVATSVFSGVAGLIDLLSRGGRVQDINAAVTSLTTAGSQRFNARFPAGLPTTACGEGPAAVNGVRFYSWTGVEQRTDALDISDPLLALTGLAFGRTRNDGLVGQCSAHFGDVIRDDYPQNHLDEINQTLGMTGIFNVNPVSLYRTQANRLMRAGL